MKYLLCAEPGDGLRVQEETEKGRVAILMEWNLLGSEGKTIKGNEGAGNGERLVKECSFSGGGRMSLTYRVVTLVNRIIL